MQDLPASERPRERLVDRGAEALTTAELLAILLRTGIRGHPVTAVAGAILKRFQTLDALTKGSIDEFCAVPGVGRDKAVTIKAAFELARRLAEERHNDGQPLDSPDKVAAVLRPEMAGLETERLVVLILNTRRKLIRIEEIGRGQLDQVLAHPREVFRRAIQANAHSIVLAHNHPSGDPSPSDSDVRITRDLFRAARLLRIDLLDHVILGRPAFGRERDYVSMRELGYFHE